MYRKHKVKGGRKLKGAKDCHDTEGEDEPEVPSCPSAALLSQEWEEKFSNEKQKKYWKNKSTGKSTWVDPREVERCENHPDRDVTLGDPPTFSFHCDDVQWESIEEEDWMGNVTVKFLNPVTRKLRSSPPGAHNVCSYIHTTFDNQQIEVFAPLRCAESLDIEVLKTACVEKWSDIEELWSFALTFRETHHERLKSILLAKMEENARLQLQVEASERLLQENAAEREIMKRELEEEAQVNAQMVYENQILREKSQANARALQAKSEELSLLEDKMRENLRLQEQRDEENEHLQEKLDMISSFLSGKTDRGQKSAATGAPRPQHLQPSRQEESSLSLACTGSTDIPPPIATEFLPPRKYVVDCPHYKALSGVYVEQELNVFLHIDGVHRLSSCASGWTIQDKGKTVCKATDAAKHPDDVQNWQYLDRQNGAFRPAFPMTVKVYRDKLQVSPVSVVAGTGVEDTYVEQASDWVCTEERDGFFDHQFYRYYNKFTGVRQNQEPAILKK